MTEQLQYLNNMLNGIDALIISLDVNYNVVYLNDNYKQMFIKLYNCDINIGDNLLNKLLLYPNEYTNMKLLWSRALSGEQFTTQIQCENNEKINIYEMTFSLVKNNKNDIVGATQLSKDITTLKIIENEKNNNINTKITFLANMSHELRTPLNIILGYAQLLQYTDNKIEINEYIKNIVNSSTFLTGLIRDTLDITRYDFGALTFSIETTNAHEIIMNIYNDMKILSDKNNLTLKIDNNNKYINILVDPLRFNQILNNLVSNAIKYNKKNGKVIIQTRVINSFLYIDIIDTGIGIPKEQFSKIGNMFERLGNNNNIEITGSGLGIAIVKMLTRHMGGFFEFTSEINVGSTFSVGFPISNEEISIIKKTSSEIPILDLIFDIIYIEDNKFNLKIMSHIVKIYMPKCKLHCCTNGYDGIKLIENIKPKLILLDINIPGMNGPNILNWIYKNLNKNDINVIIISAVSSNTIKNNCISEGVSAFFSKPLNISEFINVIQNLYIK